MDKYHESNPPTRLKSTVLAENDRAKKASGSSSCSEYVPFGDEWRAEVMKMRKADIIEMLRKSLIQNVQDDSPV